MRLARRSSRTLVIAGESSSSRRFSTLNHQLSTFYSQIDVRASPRLSRRISHQDSSTSLSLLTFRQRYGDDRRPLKIGGIFDRTIRLIMPYVGIADDMKGAVGNRAGRRFVEVRVMMRLQHRKICNAACLYRLARSGRRVRGSCCSDSDQIAVVPVKAIDASRRNRVRLR